MTYPLFSKVKAAAFAAIIAAAAAVASAGTGIGDWETLAKVAGGAALASLFAFLKNEAAVVVSLPPGRIIPDDTVLPDEPPAVPSDVNPRDV